MSRESACHWDFLISIRKQATRKNATQYKLEKGACTFAPSLFPILFYLDNKL
jgi:hypothetical protein